MAAKTLQFLPRAGGVSLAYYRQVPTSTCTPTAPLEVLFLPGFMSNMTGIKAQHIREHCAVRGWPCTTFDYSGHGASSGSFLECTVSTWLADTLAIIDEVTQGPLMLVGSSMGGWLMVLAALQRQECAKALIGLAAAPDMTERHWGLMSEEQRAALMSQGLVRKPSEYSAEGSPITRDLIVDGRTHLVLGGPIAITAPLHLLHGTEDTVVPWSSSQQLLEGVQSQDASLTLIKGSDHRLSSAIDLQWLVAAMERMQAMHTGAEPVPVK